MSKWAVRQDQSRHWTVYDASGDNTSEVLVYREKDGKAVAKLLNDHEKSFDTLAETQRRLLKEVKQLREKVKPSVIKLIEKPC